MIRIEMKVDDVKRSEKGLDSCILKCAEDEPTIGGVPIDVTMTIKAEGVDIFEDIGVPHKGCLIDIEFRDPAQTSLGD